MQIEKSVCKIINGDKIRGTGFLALIPYPDRFNSLQVLVTCNNVISGIEKEIKLIFNDKLEKVLQLNRTRKIYTNEYKDITIIEIKKEDNFNSNNFLEVDYDIIKNEKLYDKFKLIYVIHFPFGNELSLSYGLIKKVEDDIIKHNCVTERGSSGAPIINLFNCKIIGIHQGTDDILSLNAGMFLTNAINDFNKTKYSYEKKILYYDDGRYEGDVKNDKIEGKGIMYYNNGDRYEGDYKNDKAEGKGNYYWNDGTRYEGDYKNDKAEGKGIVYYKNGDRYEGDVKNDKKEGKGIMYYKNGDRYEGDWKNDKREGKGIMYYNNGKRYEGNWENDIYILL